MIIIDDEWCFIHIPKTSGTNFVKCLSDNRLIKYDHNELWDEFWGDTQIPNIFSIKSINVVKHAPLLFWQRNNIVTHHKIFSIVRNPYTRLLSFFNEFKRDLDISTLSLKEFIENDLIQEGLNSVPYNIYSLKTNQLDNFRSIDGSLILHKFFKMETDITQLQNFFNTSDLNEHKYNSSNYDRDYKNIFTNDIISWVQRTYEVDFNYFGYEFDPFWL